jgi:hypothetical protein
MGQAGRTQLIGDPEDPFVVGAANGAARGADQLGLTRDEGQGAQGRCHGLAMEDQDLVRRRRLAARRLEQGRCLAPSDAGHVVPAFFTPCRASRALGGDKVQALRRLDGGGRQGGVGQSLAPIGRRTDQPGQLEPVTPGARPGPLVQVVLALRLEDFDGRLGQVDRPPFAVPDHDPSPAARAQAGVIGRRIQDDAAVGTGHPEDGLGRSGTGRGRCRLDGQRRPRVRSFLTKEPATQPDQDHLGSTLSASGQQGRVTTRCRNGA